MTTSRGHAITQEPEKARRRAAPHLRVVVFSACPASVYARKAVALGASNYVEKGTNLDTLASIVRIAMTQPIPPITA